MGRPFQCWFVTNDMRMVDLGGRPWRFREREVSRILDIQLGFSVV